MYTVQVYNNNYPEIKVILDSNAPNLTTVQTQINLDLELGMSEEYLMYRTEQQLTTRTIQMQQHLCTLGMSNIADMERSPFHPDAMIRAQGHIKL